MGTGRSSSSAIPLARTCARRRSAKLPARSVSLGHWRRRCRTPDEYTFAHNAIVTLVGPEGGIVTRFSSDAVVDDLARALRRATKLEKRRLAAACQEMVRQQK